ncbi:hypothetical protein [Actinospica robiniae]|uniref:hypothetical protein n=1 Tax=Actinospica robiniae TaxID=304901 RepID=UPI000428A354|nr:hypothetical protein [Actinospica robiniae]
MSERISNAEAGDPLTAVELGQVLRAAATVAAGDRHHDFATILYVLNTDVLCPAGQRQLYTLEARQIARALCEVIPGEGRASLPVDPIAAVNQWTISRRNGGQPAVASGKALTELFRTAAAQVEGGAQAADGFGVQEAAG